MFANMRCSRLNLTKMTIRDLTKNKIPIRLRLVNLRNNGTMLTEKMKATILNAAKKLTGQKKREFLVQVTEDYFDGSARKAESYMGWSRETIKKGQLEKETGIICNDNYQGRGRKKTEEKLPNLERDIESLVEGESQADPQLKNTFAYTKLTAKQVRMALIEEKGYKDEELPGRVTIGTILNRMGYRLKKTQKTKPLKKIPETDEIFASVAQENRNSDENGKSVRISIDCKAKVKIGNLSREGYARRKEPLEADDHDTKWEDILVPSGILNIQTNELSIYFGKSAETSDFVVDCLEQWWEENQEKYQLKEELAINLDGGSATRSNRTQFRKRMIEFAGSTGLKIHLIYYPPYHSKYNPIERCWAALENYWNGAILETISTALEWASNMTWKGIHPVIKLIEKTYLKGVKVEPEELQPLLSHWFPSETLPKWDIKIVPG